MSLVELIRVPEHPVCWLLVIVVLAEWQAGCVGQGTGQHTHTRARPGLSVHCKVLHVDEGRDWGLEQCTYSQQLV